MKDRPLLVRDLLVLFGLAGWAMALPHYGSEFVVSMALTCLMYVALSSSWALFCGSSRYLSLATAAFCGIGAYTSALVMEPLGWGAAIALGAGLATVVAVVHGGVIGQLLNHVAGSLKPGGRLIYSVCTLTRSETTGVAAAFSAAHPELEPGPTQTLWPHEIDANGMFIAAWTRKK